MSDKGSQKEYKKSGKSKESEELKESGNRIETKQAKETTVKQKNADFKKKFE